MIVKIQRSLFPNNSSILVYNKERTFTLCGPITDEVKTHLGNRSKGYFDADIDGITLVIKSHAEDQDW